MSYLSCYMKQVGEFRVTPDALLPVGFLLRAQHFLAGQLVDVQGKTKGKGFSGAMKVWTQINMYVHTPHASTINQDIHSHR